MYLGEPYEEAVVVAEQELAAALGISTEQMRFYPRGWRIRVESEDDLDPNQNANASAGKILTNSLNVLPAGSDPNEFGRKMIYEGLPDGDGTSPSKCGAFIYVNAVPEYEREFYIKLAGVSYLHFTQPADTAYDGVYGATYSSDSSVLSCLHLEDGGSGRYVGYTYEIRDEFMDDGTLISHEDPGENGRDDMNVQISGSSVSFHIPKEAEPLVLAPRGKYHFDTTDGSGNPYVIDWYQEMSETKADYLYGQSLSYFSTMAFPKGDYCLYTMSTKTDRTEFNFR